MITATRSVGGLARAGEIALVGVLTFLSSLPLVTITAAQAAALRALQPEHSGAPGLTAVYLQALRDHLRRGLLVQLAWAVPALLGLGDLLFGLVLPNGSPASTLFVALGGTMIIFAMIIRSFLAVRLADGDADALPLLVRSAMVLAGRSPGRTLLVLLLDLACLAAGLGALIALPAVGGIALALQARLLAPYRQARVANRAGLAG